MDNVESMFYVGNRPWHGKGIPVPEEASDNIDNCLSASGLDWVVSIYPTYAHLTDFNDLNFNDFNQNILELPVYATVRESDKSLLGVVGARYVPLQNAEAFKIFQPFLDTGKIKLHTAGSLFNGKRVWILAKIEGITEIVKNDFVERYILLSHSHDGTLKISFGFTPIRVVCSNTLAMALNAKVSSLLKFKHTKNAVMNLEEAAETIKHFSVAFDLTMEQYSYLASKYMTNEDINYFVMTMFNAAEDMSTKKANIINRVIDFIHNSPGNNLKDVAGTRWAAYNGFTYYLNYGAGRNVENRLNDLWFGRSVDLSTKALNYLSV